MGCRREMPRSCRAVHMGSSLSKGPRFTPALAPVVDDERALLGLDGIVVTDLDQRPDHVLEGVHVIVEHREFLGGTGTSAPSPQQGLLLDGPRLSEMVDAMHKANKARTGDQDWPSPGPQDLCQPVHQRPGLAHGNGAGRR